MTSKHMQFTLRVVSILLVIVSIFSCFPVIGIAAEETTDPLVVVSLGDSYSAGEGIPDFYGPVPGSYELEENFWNRRIACNDFMAHRSPKNWPGQLKFSEISGTIGDYRVPDGETSTADVQWYFVAASGAVSKEIYEKKQVRKYKRTITTGTGGPKKVLSGSIELPVQLDIIGKIEDDVDYVTLTIGGNDVGFSTIVEQAAHPKYSYSTLENTLKTLEENIATYEGNIKTAYSKVNEATGGTAEIIVAGYPELFDKEGKGALISKKEATLVNSKVVWFNEQLEQWVKDKKEDGIPIHFVDVISTFDGHQAYSSNAWINKIYAGAKDDDLEEDKASCHSMHPNATGAEKYAACVNRKIAEIEYSKRIGTLSGKICKASDRTTPVTSAKINAYSPLRSENATPDSNGNYSMQLPENRYYVTVKADGYIPFKAYAVVKENQTEYMQTFLMVEGEETDIGSAQGMITNALNGAGLDGVTLDVRAGWNNENEGEILTTVTTDDYGAYLVTLPIGNYTLCASKDGFAPTMINIVVQKTNSGNQDGTMTPVLSGDSYRIVLRWGENPRDLDSHVVGSLSEGNSFHVYYSHKSQYDGDVEVCNLDVDDVDGEGPETITLNTTTSKPYYYYIYRYAGSGTVASSGAQIKVYQGDRVVKTFNVPTNLGSGDYWNVFAIVDGQLVVRNTMTSSAETNYASSNISTFSLRAPRVEEHPVYDNSYPAKEAEDSDVTNPTEETSVATEPEATEQENITEVPAIPETEPTEEITEPVETEATEGTEAVEVEETEIEEPIEVTETIINIAEDPSDESILPKETAWVEPTNEESSEESIPEESTTE